MTRGQDSTPDTQDRSLFRRLSGWAANLALLLVTLVVLLGVAEVVTRAFGKVEIPLVNRDPLVGSTYRPDFEGMVYNKEGEREVLIRTNRSGFRGPDRPYEAAPGTRRIAIIGDSFIAAMACFDEETVVVQLEERLQASHPSISWEVMNFGLSASSTGQELALYRHVVSRYEPDLVIVAFFVGNDFQDNDDVLSNSSRIYFRLGPDGELEQMPLSPGRVGMNAWLNRNSRFYVWQKEATRMFRIRGPEGQVYRTEPTPVLDNGWALTAKLIETFAEEVERNGSRFLLAVLPTGEQVYEDMWETRMAVAEDLAGVAIDRDHPDRKLTAIADGAGIPVLTMTDEFRATATADAAETPADDLLFYRGYGHFTPRGHALAADVIHEYLVRGDGRDIFDALGTSAQGDAGEPRHSERVPAGS